MGLNIQLRDDNSYIDIKDSKTSATDESKVSTFTTETLPLADKKLLDILSKNQDSIPPELLAYFKQTGMLSPGWRGEISISAIKGSPLDKWMVSKHMKIKKYHIDIIRIIIIIIKYYTATSWSIN